MTAVSPGSSQQAVVEAALVPLERVGLSPADLAAVPQSRKPVPTFAAYVPVVSAAVSDGTRRAYGSYWNPAHRPRPAAPRRPPARSGGRVHRAAQRPHRLGLLEAIAARGRSLLLVGPQAPAATSGASPPWPLQAHPSAWCPTPQPVQ